MLCRHDKFGLGEFSENGKQGSFRISQRGVDNHKLPGARGQFGHRLRRQRDNTDSPTFDIENAFERILAGDVVVDDQDGYFGHGYFSQRGAHPV